MAVDARLELLSPLGDIEGLGFVETFARVDLSSPLGDLNVVAGPVIRFVRGDLPSPLGYPSADGFVPPAAWLALSSPLGALRVTATPFSDDWGVAGLPTPSVSGYSYTNDPGLQRTPMLSGYVWQRRRWDLGYYQLSAQFTMLIDEVPILEEFVLSHAGDWFVMNLVTGNTERQHVVRISADPEYGSVYAENIDITISLDVRR